MQRDVSHQVEEEFEAPYTACRRSEENELGRAQDSKAAVQKSQLTETA